MAFGFLKKAVRTAGKGLKSVGKATGKVAGGALKITGNVLALLLTAGFIAVPVGVMTGVVS